jgi:hypothetical protein
MLEYMLRSMLGVYVPYMSHLQLLPNPFWVSDVTYHPCKTRMEGKSIFKTYNVHV